MKLLDDLYYVLENRDCGECEFLNFCAEGINGTSNEDNDDYNLCEVLKMAKDSIE